MRLSIAETPAFQRAIDSRSASPCRSPTCCREHKRGLLLGVGAALATFVLFYLMTVFALS